MNTTKYILEIADLETLIWYAKAIIKAETSELDNAEALKSDLEARYAELKAEFFGE